MMNRVDVELWNWK